MKLSQEELDQMAALIRAEIGDVGPFRPVVFHHPGLNYTTVLVRDCSVCEEPENSDGVALLRDNYREGNVVGLRFSGPLVGLEKPALTAYMTAETTPERDAAFLRTYAERVRNGTAASWEIPNTVATTLEDIAARILIASR